MDPSLDGWEGKYSSETCPNEGREHLNKSRANIAAKRCIPFVSQHLIPAGLPLERVLVSPLLFWAYMVRAVGLEPRPTPYKALVLS